MAGPPPRSSPGLNPFDSDDDLGSPHSNSFNHHAPPRSRLYAPRDSRATHELTPDRTSIRTHQRLVLDPRNPFDDDGPALPPLKPNDREGSKTKAPSVAGQGEGQRMRKSGKSLTRECGDESGVAAALKNSRKSDHTEVNQPSKLREERVNLTQRPKESGYSTLKSNERNVQLKSRNSSSRSHDQLVASDMDDRNGFSSGRGPRIQYSDNQFQGADLQGKSVQELEDYALQKSEETTKSIQNSLKLAETIRGDAETTLITLHGQGEQIRRTHEMTLEIDESLYAGEKLLGSLGGMLSKTWRPQSGRPVAGPALVIDDSVDRKAKHLQQRVALGLDKSNRKGISSRSSLDSGAQSHQQTTQDKLETERGKQDDALSDLSNILGQLKEMSIDMGSEISRQSVALDNLHDDTISLDERVKGANIRGRKLLGK